MLRIPHLNASMPLKFGCGKGNCGTCVIKVINGEENLSSKTKEEIATLDRLGVSSSYRLACQCAVKGDVEIDA